MQTETQNQPITPPENAVNGESKQSKSKRGGRRPGAGRKPNLAKRLLTVWRPLATLSDEEVQLLDAITKKLGAPTADTSQNAPQNQIESKPAIETVPVEECCSKDFLSAPHSVLREPC